MTQSKAPCRRLLLPLVCCCITAIASRPAHAQDIHFRLERAHMTSLFKVPRELRRATPEHMFSESRWKARGIRARQVGTGPLGVPGGIPQPPVGPVAPNDPAAQAGTPANVPGDQQTPGNQQTNLTPKAPREVQVYVDGRLGFDNEKTVVNVPGALEVDIKRRIRTLSLNLGYPIANKTRLAVSIPYIDQSTDATAPALNKTIHQSGRGIGDVGVFAEQYFPEISKGTQLSVALGLQFPTGKDPFSVGPNELPTGIGFYQALVHATIRKMVVPLQFYGSVDYGKGFSRNIAGQHVSLPDSYGAEVGFYYTLSPEFTAQTAVSWDRLSSPFMLGPGQHVAYLSQSLNYNTGKRTQLRGSVDVGLTQESTDAYVGLALNSSF